MRRALVLLLLLFPATAEAEVLEELSVKTRDGATVHVEIARPDPPPRASQHAYGRVAGRRIDQEAQSGNDVGDVGLEEQAAQADHLTRHTFGAQRRLERRELRPPANKDRHLRP